MFTRLAVLGLAAAVLVAPARAAEESTITVEGSAIVSAAPDTALLSLGVVSEGATAGEAMAAASAAATKTIAAIKGAGVEPRDIQTSDFSLQPVYSDGDDNVAPRIDGYSVRNTVTVRVRALDKIGAIVDTAVASGANQVQGLTFAVADAARRRDEARAGAFQDAKRRAELYAAAAGVTLGPVRSIAEQTGGYPGPRPMMKMMAAEAAPMPVETGEVELSVDVTVVFTLLPKAP